jgi:molecular chaperone GrpE (heat shock protein)
VVNPVAAEKSLILDEAVLLAASQINAQTSPEGLYTIYAEGLKFCLQHLDDLHSRKTARFYTELIGREFEELGNIIKMPKEPTESDEESITVAGILDALQEAYQATEPIIRNFQTLQNAPQKTSVRTVEEFEAAINSASPSEPPERKRFFAALDAEGMILLDGIDVDYKRAAYSLQRQVSAEVLLAEEVTGVFSKALQNLNADAEGVEGEILKGIRETIEIKISGLQESTQSFSEQGGGTLKNFSAEKGEPPEGERAEILAGIRAAWLESPPQKNELAEFFDACQCGEIFEPCRERVKSQIDTYAQKLEKASLRFKKEVLLYEVCTFEEILTHSVSRLRDSANADVISAAQLLDSTFLELEVILKKNNIEVIRPAVREIFNAKEHEILVAEKHEGFEKGEIIKIITAGYKMQDRIILRANVIAAR